MRVRFKKLHPQAELPTYQTESAAAMDLVACLDTPVELQPFERVVIPTGIAIELPSGYEAQVRARSGLSLKHGITLANGVGTIDADYRGEVGVILANISQDTFEVTHGMRIAQMVVARHETVEWTEASELGETARGAGGYGHTAH